MQVARADVIVIGAGVVGLACARALAPRRRVLVLERHDAAGREGSARNSGVIHAGVHHPRSFAKTELCVRGRALLLEHCAGAGVPHRVVGKLIVATEDAERESLAAIARRAAENGVPCERVGGAAARRLEPRISCRDALHVPGTGVVATHELVASLESSAIGRGAEIAYGREVRAIERAGEWIVEADGSAGAMRARAAALVIAGGLGSDRLAQWAGIDLARLGGPHRFCAGRWMSLDRRFDRAVSRLVYPVPTGGGLGVHLTLELDGSLRAGPDAVWLEAASPQPSPPATASPDVRAARIDPPDARAFADAIARYLPGVTERDLAPGPTGIRAKLHGPREPVADFAIHVEDGLVALLGIESPGLTACLAIAERGAAALVGGGPC